MQTVRDAWGRAGRESLFNDHYGILRLAADATVTKTSILSKLVGSLSLKWVQWKKRILAAIKQFWQDNTVTCSDFIWLEPEILTYKIIEKSRTKTTKKINYKRRYKNLHQKTSGVKNTKQASMID